MWFKGMQNSFTPNAAAERSKLRTVFVRSSTLFLGSFPSQSMHIYVSLFSVCVVLYVCNGLAMGRSSVQGVLPSGYMTKTLRKFSEPNKGL
jgi:hypothetical protein